MGGLMPTQAWKLPALALPLFFLAPALGACPRCSAQVELAIWNAGFEGRLFLVWLPLLPLTLFAAGIAWAGGKAGPWR
jgi:hypothetical protein